MDAAIPRFDVTVAAIEIDAVLARTENPRHRGLLLNMREHLLLEAGGHWREVLSPALMVEEPSFHLYTPDGRVRIDGQEAVWKFYEEYWEAEPSRSAAATLVPRSAPGSEIVVTDSRVIGISELASQRWGRELLSMASGRAVATGRKVAGDVDPDGLYLETYQMVYVFEYGSGDRLIGENTYSGGDSNLYRLSPDDLVTPQDAVRLIAPYLADPPPRYI